MAIENSWMTVKDVAEELGVTTGRIRQILAMEAPDQKVRIGTKFGPAWALTRDDVDKIRGFIRKFRD